MKFINSVADIAETEGHHPDIHVSYNRVTIELYTHSIGGLSENDFIVAAKIDEIGINI
jgi:4a-hydroxytetrahydrobiopterin dehydratase